MNDAGAPSAPRTASSIAISELAMIAALHAIACGLVLALGFDHVSDDDFARVTIAQSFAHAPKLDPSATSWLPFPFWSLGAVMIVAGRSLATARVASIAFASLAATLPYVALRMTGASRAAARVAIAFALLSPWSLWLGAATVPESFTASFTAAAVIGLGSVRGPRLSPAARSGFAIALLAACLSRYEAWPAAAVLAITLAVRGARARARRWGVLQDRGAGPRPRRDRRRRAAALDGVERARPR